MEWIRGNFPALKREINGKQAIFFDGPGGTQVTQSVIDAMAEYLVKSNANCHGAFITSEGTDATIFAARNAIADFLGCDGDEVVFGANMTSLTFSISRAIGRELQQGDEIIVTRLDHDANIAPWLALKEKGAVVNIADVNVADCTLDMEDLQKLINPRTRLIAVGYASNAVGTINDIAKIVQLARCVGAKVFVDAVHYAPHGLIDVKALDCDFLACSAYKFFAPHVGILYAKREHLTNLTPYKVRPATEEIPARWETGTQNHEGLAGIVAAIDYLASLGRRISSTPNVENRRTALVAAMKFIQEYEKELSRLLIAGLVQVPGLRIYGITDLAHFDMRTPTFAIKFTENTQNTPEKLAQTLGQKGIFTWNGNFYALGLTEKLGVESTGGLLRVGLVHYNTVEEIQRFLEELGVKS